MNNKVLALGAMFLMLVFAPFALADSHSMSPLATVGNAPPVIYYMALDAGSYDPTEASTTTVSITARVRDDNGVGDINDSEFKTEVDDVASFVSAVAKYTNASCVTADLSATEREYNCTWSMDYWDSAGTYSTQVTAGDNTGTVSNGTADGAPTYSYTTLVASGIDSTTISFGSVTTGTTNNPATENPITLNNTGNANLSINVTGADLTGNGHTYVVGNFSVDLDSNPTGEQALTSSNAQIVGASILQGNDGTPSPTEELYWFADTPTGLKPASYSGTWTLTQW